MSFAVIGLGIGTLAAYGQDGDTVTFFELNPAVVALAEDSFRYLKTARQSGTNVSTLVGDGRLMLRHVQPDSVDFLVVDAFASDFIPPHLLTLEAMQAYRRVLRKTGVIAFHTSSRYLSLEGILLATAARAGLWGTAVVDPGDDLVVRSATTWVFMTSEPERTSTLHDVLLRNPLVTALATKPATSWTDARYSILEALR